MKFEIKNRWSGDILFSVEAESFRLAVEMAVKSGADLSRANLSRANLSGADLSRAGLCEADLCRANLCGANLCRANLSRANLSGAGLYGANLSRANLSEADLFRAGLSEADLSRANLYGTNLCRANLSGADLSEADLSGAIGVNKNLCTPLTILLDQPGKIRAYKLVTQDGVGPYYPEINYLKGKTFSIDNYNESDNQCGTGISLATLDWCMREWKTGYRILVMEFTAKDIVSIPFATDGKFRVKKCKRVGEKDLKEIGLEV